MNKKKFTVMTLLLIVVFVLTSCVLFACNPDAAPPAEEPKEIEATEGLLISNSDFKVVDTTVTTYPRSMTGWTGAKMYSSGAFRDDVTAGAISLASDLYNANKSKWADDDGAIEALLRAGSRYGDDDKVKNALMIYMPEEGKNSDGDKIHGATAFGYTSNSFTLAKGAYYKLSVDVLTYKIGGENEADRGARIYVSSNTYAEFSAIDTKGEWKTYEVYIETSPSSTTSLTLQLGLGKYSSSYTKGLTTGYVFFDNVVLEKIDDNAETPEVDGEKAYKDAVAKQLAGNKQVTTTTLKVPNGTFDFGSTSISSSSTPSSWALVTGNSGKSDPAPTSLGFNGVIDLSKFEENYSKYSPTYQTRSAADTEKNVEYIPAKDLGNIKDLITNYSGRIGNNAFMLSQQLMTAQGIKSSRTITIEKNKTYALSIQVYTYGIHGAGVSLILSGSDGKDIVIKGISSNRSDDVLIGSQAIDPNNNGYNGAVRAGATTGKWETYTFYIKGNAFRNYNYNMTVWLGTEGTSSNDSVTYHSYTSSGNATTYTANHTFSNGWVFLDDLKLDEIANLPEADDHVLAANEDQTLDCETSGTAYTGLLVDLTTENLFGDILTGSGTSTLSGVTAIGDGAPTGWTSKFDTTDATKPVIDGIISEGIVNIADKAAFEALGLDIGAYPELPYDIVTKKAYAIHASHNSSYEADSQEFTIKANHFYRISAWIKTVDVSSTSGAYVYLVDKSKDEDATLTSFTKINTKELDEYHNDWCELTIVVRGAKNKDMNVALRFGLGTGDRWATSTLTSGTLYVANLSMSSLTFANFNDTTTGTYVKSVNLSKSYTYTFTNGSFDEYDLDDENIDPEKALSEQSFAVTPDNFTVNDSTLKINKADSDLFAGIIALTPNPSGKGFVSSTQATTATGIDASVFDAFYNNVAITDGAYAGPNLLAMGTKSEAAAFGFASDKLTLSANTYYQLSVYAKTVNNAKATIFLSGESSATGSSKIKVEGAAAGEWTKYTFFIEVGNTSVSLKLNLWFGEDYTMVDGDGTEDEKKEAAKSSGAVFFDNIVYKQIEEKDYNEAVTDNGVDYKVSFLTDSFDPLSSSIESRKELLKPENWSGSADINQTSANSKVGIVYADSNYYETENVENVAYAKLLGIEYKEDDMTVSDKELADAKALAENAGLTDDQIIAKLKAAKVVEAKKANWIPVSQLKAHSGNSMLVINNTVESAYIYTSGSNTLKENSYYKVSVWVATYGLNDGADTGANIELYLGSANESTNPFIFKGINTAKATENEAGTAAESGPVWKQYCFFVKTLDDDVTSVTLKLSLGKYISGEDAKITGLTKGYAMFDDVCFETIDADEFDAVQADEQNLTRTVASSTSGTPDDLGNNGSTTTPTKGTFNLDNLWWMIPTIVIALVIIAVVIVLIVRKVRKPVAKKLAKPAPNPVNAEMVEKKLDKYEDGKE